MTARSERRRGIRTHRKRPTHRRQRKRQTHRKRRGHHKRQRGGAGNIIYFNEAFAENMTAAARLEDPAEALAEERKSGFLSNYYTRFIDGLPQDNLDMDNRPPPTQMELARANDRFAVDGIKDRVKGFYYDDHWFANAEQALAFAKGLWMNPGGDDEMSRRLMRKILITYNPDTVKIIGSSRYGLPADDGRKEPYKIIFTRVPSDPTIPVAKPDTPEYGPYTTALFKDWAIANQPIMMEIQMAKYSPIGVDDEMKRWLKATGDATLAEAAKDPFWGIGMLKADVTEKIEAERSWPGQNKLGDILMRVRGLLPE